MSKIMKHLFLILFLVTSNYFFCQNKKIQKENLFFPEKSFDCLENKDLIGNEYWTNFLLGCHKKSLFKDTTSMNTFRLLYWGTHVSIIEIVKEKSLIRFTVDSLSNYNDKVYRTIDSLQINSSFVELNKLIDLLWDKRSYENCSDSLDYSINDAFSWVLEFRVGNKYKVIERQKPDIEIKNAVNCLLDICKVTNKNIRIL